MNLTGITFTDEGQPEYLVQGFRQRIREIAATLPPGQTELRIRVSIDHPKPKSPRRGRRKIGG